MQSAIRSRARASRYPATFAGLTPALLVGYALLFLTFGVGDIGSTLLASRLQPAGQEVNPVSAFALLSGAAGFIAAKFAVFVAAWLLTYFIVGTGEVRWRKVITVAIFACSAIYTVITASNLMAAFAGQDLFNWLNPNWP